MVKRNVKLTWDATNGVIAHSLKKYDVVEAAYQSGCIGLHVGIESGNPQILKDIKKPGTVETFIEASEVLSKFPSINIRALLMLGFPKETLSMMFDTIELAEKINFDWANISILQPWKGTPIYQEMSDDGLIGETEGTLKEGDEKAAAKLVAGYQLGTYSRQRAIESGKITTKINIEDLKNGFLNKIKANDMNIIPSAKELDDLWFYMNLRINFARLLRENRSVKIEQQYKFLEHVCNKTAPDNALIIYFFAHIEKKYKGKVSSALKKRIVERLDKSDYWKERFSSFKLDPKDVVEENFPPAINSGGIPNGYQGSSKRFIFPTYKHN